MTKKKMKSTPIGELKDKYFGKEGTKSRDEYEAEKNEVMWGEKLKDLIKKFEAKGYVMNIALFNVTQLAGNPMYAPFTHLILADLQKWCIDKGFNFETTFSEDMCGMSCLDSNLETIFMTDGDTYNQALYEALKEVINQNLLK